MLLDKELIGFDLFRASVFFLTLLLLVAAWWGDKVFSRFSGGKRERRGASIKLVLFY